MTRGLSIRCRRIATVILLLMFFLLFVLWYVIQRVDIWKAVQEEDLGSIRRYVAQGGDLKTRSLLSGKTPLYYALELGKRESYRELLKQGASPNTICRGGRVVMHWAAAEEDPFWLRLALEHGGDPDLRNERISGVQWSYPISFAVGECRLQNVKLLCEYGANLNQPDERNRTPLNKACAVNRFDIALLLLDNGADYNYPSSKKNTTFIYPMKGLRRLSMFTKRKDFQAVTQWLIDHGADPRTARWVGDRWEFSPSVEQSEEEPVEEEKVIPAEMVQGLKTPAESEDNR